ncbi:MAG: hypothetical protein ACE5HV_07715 [Acidobacteriota bacterium]
MRVHLTMAWVAAIACLAGVVLPEEADMKGAWRAESYILKEGVRHTVDGLLFFAERDWSVLFFVTGADGVPRRGSAEAGTYLLTADRLVFTHLYNLSGGEEMEGLPASDWRMQINQEEDAVIEPVRVEIAGDRLTLHFPSGNRMILRRSS